VSAVLPTDLTVAIPVGSMGLVLPIPPSVNHLRTVLPVRNKKTGRTVHVPVKTDRANAWAKLVAVTLRVRYPGVPCPTPPLKVWVRLLVRSYGRIDVDNIGKALLDCLLRPLGVNDALVIDYHVTKHLLPARRGGPVRCEVILSATTAEELP
jgi:Holliday junction resolvase RusA-like endonuclease